MYAAKLENIHASTIGNNNFMQVQKTFMQVRFKTFMQIQKTTTEREKNEECIERGAREGSNVGRNKRRK